MDDLSHVPDCFKAKEKMGVEHWPLSKEVWPCEGEPWCDWTNEKKTYKPLHFDPRYSSCLANRTGIKGLGPCLQNKECDTQYILKDETEKYYYFDEELSLLMTFPEEWDEEEVICTVVQNLIHIEGLTDWWQWKAKVDAEAARNSEIETLEQSVPTTPTLSALAIEDKFTSRPSKSLLKRSESPVKAKSPSKLLHEWHDEASTTTLPSDVSYDTHKRFCCSASNDTSTTDTTFMGVADIGKARKNSVKADEKEIASFVPER